MGESRVWLLMVVAALVVGLISVLLAQSPPFGDGQLGTMSTRRWLLVAGAIPWLLQWCALAMLFGAAIRYTNYLSRRHTWAVLLIPLVVGATWWAGIIGTHWEDDPNDTVLKLVMLSVMQAAGAESLWQGILYKVLGPLICPLMLQGPYRMDGWSYVWTALSTCMWFLLLVCQSKLVESKRFGWAFLVGSSYSLPIALRSALRVVSSMSSP